MEKLRKLAGITKWPDNGLRHSFGSYHLAHFQNPNMTALQIGHSTTDMLFKRYRNYRIRKRTLKRIGDWCPRVSMKKSFLSVVASSETRPYMKIRRHLTRQSRHGFLKKDSR